MLEELIQQITRALQINVSASTKKGEFILTFKRGIQITLIPTNKNEITMLGYVGKPFTPSPNNEKKLKDILHWNLARLKAHPETLSWEPEKNQLILFKKITAFELSETPILKQLEAFLNSLEYWNKAVEENPTQKLSRFPI